MPFDLGHDVARLVPALRLVAEAGVVAPHLVRWSPDRALQQMSDLVLQDLVGRQADRVAGTLGFEKLVNLGIREGCVTSEIQMLHNPPVTRNHRLQQRAPAVSAVDVARPQDTAFDIAELVEHKQRMIAGTSEMPVVGAAFLFAKARAFARVHVEYDGLWPSPPAHLVDPLTGQIGKNGEILGPAQPLCLEAPIRLAEAADPLIARSPTTQRIAGRGTAARRRSRPHNRPAFRTPIGAEGPPADADHSCRYACRPAYQLPYRSGTACRPVHGRPAARHRR